MTEHWYWRTFWTLVLAVVVSGLIVWFVNSHTDVGSNTASNEAVTTPVTPPPAKPQAPAAASPTTP